ncbi:hypothetical protein [Mucilaginibacter sp.]|uniref:hypothetical protein n=1 Tax=Mucilaginibacter sp. TaxID=1882438 RepID=UPI003263C50D
MANGDYFNLVYSAAHIDDLQRSSNHEKTLIDLNSIKSYTKNQCIAKYWGENEVTYSVRDVLEFFESSTDDKFEIKDTFKFIDEECAKLGIESPLAGLGELTHNIKFETLTELFPDNFNAFLNKSKTDPSLRALLEDALELLSNQEVSRSLMKATRLNFDKYILPRKILGNVKHNVISYLNDNLPKTLLKKSFDDFTNDSLNINHKNKPYSYYEWFHTRYANLDLIGYKSDNKSTTSNIVTDASHAFYAAHCDLFLTEDSRLRDKAQIIYEESQIGTIILNQKQFCEKLNGLIYKISNLQDIINYIKHIKDIPQSIIYSNIESKSVVRNYNLQQWFAGYFDLLITADTVDNHCIYTFVKLRNSLSNWYYNEELKVLVKIFVDIFGVDHCGMTFLGNNLEELKSGKTWVGRQWTFNNVEIRLTQELDLGFTLRVEVIL